jgi:hypothetical protein
MEKVSVAKNSNVLQRDRKPFFQARLTVGPTDDVYEKEADAVADKVMRMTDSHQAVQPKLAISSIQRTCHECQEEEEQAQRKESGGTSSEAPSIVHDVVHSQGGSKLDDSARGFMENRFGYDFSNVKIHDNTVAAKSAQSINALAYTSGNNIVFNQGQYSPGTNKGKKLLAHELTHVVQQNHTIATKRIQRQTDAGYERLSGVDGGLRAGTMVADPLMGRTFNITCGNQYTMGFKIAKAYKGTYPYAAAGRDVRAVYIKIEASYTDLHKCGRCTPMRLIQVVRDTQENAAGNLETVEPHGAARQQRAGWGDPAAASRGWYVDTTPAATNPYVTNLGYHADEGSETTPAILWDSPGEWTATRNRGGELQTCAVCEDAAHRRKIVACVTWGYFIDSSGNIAFRPATPLVNCNHTTEARDASQRWDTIAGNTPTGITF